VAALPPTNFADELPQFSTRTFISAPLWVTTHGK
jgi:hypothetical protein